MTHQPLQKLHIHRAYDENWHDRSFRNLLRDTFCINYANSGKNLDHRVEYLEPCIETESKTKLKVFLEKFKDFASSLEPAPQFFSTNNILGYPSLLYRDLFVSFHNIGSPAQTPIQVEIWGDGNEINKFLKLLYRTFNKYSKEGKCFIDWVYVDGCSTSTFKKELDIRNLPFTEMYPFLNGESLEDYYDRFNSSPSSILLLQGPPGTGKTSFIRGLMHHCKKNCILSYDEAVLKADTFLRNFIESSSIDYLIFEDADSYLTSRERGNSIIHKFLNASDGLISPPNKKIIFTTNLSSLSEIDHALIRPGRCFDVLQFRPLTKEESLAVSKRKDVNEELPDQSFTIAEIFNRQRNTEKKEKRLVGFF